jgi:hypothetical protein
MRGQLSSNEDRQGVIVEAQPPASWIVRVKMAARGGVLLMAEAAGAVASVVGAPLAAFTGKLYLAVLIALFGLGCYLRFVRLRQKRRQTGRSPVQALQRPPAWLAPTVGALSAVEVALLVEATRLPVRADQPGFDTANWWWVIAGFILLFWLQRGWMIDRLQAARLHK